MIQILKFLRLLWILRDSLLNADRRTTENIAKLWFVDFDFVRNFDECLCAAMMSLC